MPKNNSTKRRNKLLQNFSHYLIGLSILAKGWAKLEHYHHQLGEVIFIFLAGIFIIAGTAFHDRFKKRIKNFTASFHIAEGLALSIIGWIFFEEGSSRLSYFYFFIGMVYFVIGITFLFVNEEKKEDMQRRMQLWLGIAFLATGFITFILNQINDNNAWVNVMSLMFVGAGLVLMIRSKLKKKSRIIPE